MELWPPTSHWVFWARPGINSVGLIARLNGRNSRRVCLLLRPRDGIDGCGKAQLDSHETIQLHTVDGNQKSGKLTS